MHTLTAHASVNKLQDNPRKWEFETYGRIVDASYLIEPKEFKKIVGKDYKDVEVDYEWSLIVEPWEYDYQAQIQPRLDEALQWLTSPYEDGGKPRLEVFTKPRYGDLRLSSLHPFSVIGDPVPDNERYERRTVRCVFSLLNYNDGQIIATPQVIEIMPNGFYPGEGIVY